MPLVRTEKKTSESELEITRAEAARMLGVSRTQVQRLTERGILKSRQDDNGVHHYDVAHIESMKDRLNLGDHDQQAVLFESQNSLIEMALEHARLTFKPVHDATHAAMQVLKDENDALRGRCRKLESTHIDLIITLETLLSEKHARDMLTEETNARIANRRDIVDTFKKAAGPLLEQVQATIASRNSMYRFLSVVDKEKLKALLFSGLLSEEETAALREMLGSAGISFPEPSAVDTADNPPVPEPSEAPSDLEE